jgi:hypothetical protein
MSCGNGGIVQIYDGNMDKVWGKKKEIHHVIYHERKRQSALLFTGTDKLAHVWSLDCLKRILSSIKTGLYTRPLGGQLADTTKELSSLSLRTRMGLFDHEGGYNNIIWGVITCLSL